LFIVSSKHYRVELHRSNTNMLHLKVTVACFIAIMHSCLHSSTSHSFHPRHKLQLIHLHSAHIISSHPSVSSCSKRRIFCAPEFVLAVQGHPKSMILVPIESAYNLCDFLLVPVRHSNVGPLTPFRRYCSFYVLLTPPLFHRNYGGDPVAPDRPCDQCERVYNIGILFGSLECTLIYVKYKTTGRSSAPECFWT